MQQLAHRAIVLAFEVCVRIVGIDTNHDLDHKCESAVFHFPLAELLAPDAHQAGEVGCEHNARKISPCLMSVVKSIF